MLNATVGVPESIDVVDDASGFTIVRRRNDVAGGAMSIAVAMLWIGSIVETLVADTPPREGVGMLGFLIAIGGVLAYRGVAMIVNRTTIALTAAALQVRHAPLWWPSRRDVPVDHIVEIYEREVKGRRGRDTYDVRVRVRNKTLVFLVSGLLASEARFIAATLRAKLGVGSGEPASSAAG
nr:hypothetical protein [Kofleriaceae bacterium]